MNTSQTLAPGTLLYNGDYRIVRVLGRGGFGITYLAENVNLEKRVAIKEFFPQGMYNRDGVSGYASVGSVDNNEIVDKLKKKFLKEARRLAGLRDDSIVAVSNAFEENGTAYYVMDFIEGRDLQTIVREEGPMAVDRALRYVRQVGDALDYLHDRRINHLDVKPANILVDPSKDRAVLIDFGLSKQYDENDHQTSTTPVGVSRGYAPFEQYKAGGVKEFSAPTDVYSLGATLYYLLTGERPPEANELVEDPLVIPSSVPDWLRSVILKAMAYRRADRYQTVSDFLADLNATKCSQKTENSEDITIIDADPVEVKIEPQTNPNQEMKTPVGKIFIWVIIALVVGGVVAYFTVREQLGDYDPQKVYMDSIAKAQEAQVSVQTPEVGVEGLIHHTPSNLDLCVTLNGKTGFISEDDWKKLSSNEKNQVTKKGLYVSGEGQRFLLALEDLQEEPINWDDAMAKYGSRLPSKSQARVMGNNCKAINIALSVYGGRTMDTHGYENWYWTRTEDDSSRAWLVSMYYGLVGNYTKTLTYRVRAVAPAPVASAM